MTHWRTSRRTVGGFDQPGGSPHGADTHADSIPLLFFAMVIAPLLFVGLIVLCHRTLS